MGNLLPTWLAKTTTTANEGKQALKEVKEGIDFQKEIIEKFFSKNISDSLREKLNTAYQKAQAAEKIIPELEKLAQEY
ncbi:5529_t:CDS:2 [Ambispora leptoticha]|uniref:5529_t:CDS:1 n=1 Tax=Ambispora leptoticha TaxID=144679 RepID=A0A9N9ETJ2_9GLOM|nr:5529_t:CDS:2 [Ambispora leptoticha]